MTRHSRKITFEVPVRTVSLTNQREHWAVRSKRARRQREAVQWVWLEEVVSWKWKVHLPCAVTLTRIAPRELDDDNLRGALKTIRDEVARLIGIDDRDPRVVWFYRQERSTAKHYSVRVEIVSDPDPCFSEIEWNRPSAPPSTAAHAQ